MKIRNLALLMALSLAACGGIGSGSKPEGLKFVEAVSDTTEQTTLANFQCVIAQPLLVATFTDGSIGIFNSRATYTSSNPDVVRVSNGDIAVPGQTDVFYSRGTLLALGSKGQTARVTAEFAGLKATLDVTVDAYDTIAVKRQEFTASDNTTKLETTRMVVGTRQQLRAEAVDSGGKTRDVTTAGVWSIDAPDETVATIGEFTGIFATLGVPTGTTTVTKTARVKFPACDTTLMTGTLATTFPDSVDDADNATASANIKLEKLDGDTQTLRLVQESGFTPGRMITGTAQFIRTLVQFPNDGDANFAEEQDMTFAGIVFSLQDTVDPAETATSFLYSFLSTLLVAIEAGEANISASFGVDDEDTPENEQLATPPAAPLLMKAIDATLVSIDLQPAAATIPALNPATVMNFNTQQFTVLATFTPATPAECPAPCTQPFHHDVIWTRDVTDQLVISTAAATAGLAVVIKNPEVDTDVTVTATSNQAVDPAVVDTVPFDTAVLTVQPSP